MSEKEEVKSPVTAKRKPRTSKKATTAPLPQEEPEDVSVLETVQKQDQEDDRKDIAQQRGGLVSALGLFFLELIKIVALAAVTIGIVRYFLIQPFYVKGKSMEPTFYENEYLIIDKITYRVRDWENKEPILRGDIVVLRAPNDPTEHYLKRVIGLPGERIKIDQNRVIIYNEAHPQGLVLREQYLQGVETGGAQTLTLGPNQYYVLGDNRGASFDSRRFGPIDRGEIVGRTWFRGWPLTRITLFQSPEYSQ